MFLNKFLEKIPSFIKRIYLLVIVMISFIIFNGGEKIEILKNIGGLIGIGKVPLISAESIYYLKSYFIILIIGIIGATPIMKNTFTNQKNRKFINCLEPIFLVIVFVISISYIIDGSFNPFLYFRF